MEEEWIGLVDLDPDLDLDLDLALASILLGLEFVEEDSLLDRQSEEYDEEGNDRVEEGIGWLVFSREQVLQKDSDGEAQMGCNRPKDLHFAQRM